MAEGKKTEAQQIPTAKIWTVSPFSSKLVELFNKTRNPSSETGQGGFSVTPFCIQPLSEASGESAWFQTSHLHEPGWKQRSHLNIGWLHWLVMAVEVGEVKHYTSTFENLMGWSFRQQLTWLNLVLSGFGPQAEKFRAEIEQNTCYKVRIAFD